MLSCCFIEKGLTFAPDGLYHCSIPVHGNRGWPYICNYDGETLPIDKILVSRQKLIEAFAKGDMGSCSFCNAWLCDKEWYDSYYPFSNLNIEQYTLCNLRCSYCCWLTNHPAEFGRLPYPMLPVLKEIFEKQYLDPNGTIFWGGGEPALLQEFSDCLDICIEQNIAVEISSNSTVFSNAILRGLQSGKCSLCTSIDAGTSETYLNIKKKNLFDCVWRNLEIYASSGTDKLSVNYIVTDYNKSQSDIDGFINSLVASCLHCPIILDISHEKSIISNEIIETIASFALKLRSLGFTVYTGLHGSATLPLERLVERVETQICIIELGNKLAKRDKEVEQCHKDLNSIYNSRSWRLTAPLRTINKAFTKFKYYF
jgi:organic radical activating enzyme